MSEKENSFEGEFKTEIVDEVKPDTSGCVFPTETKYAHIKNKQVRNQQFQKWKREQKKVILNRK